MRVRLSTLAEKSCSWTGLLLGKLWKIQTMPKNQGSFDIRTPLCEAWCGLRNAELNAATGLSDTEFVHRAGFIGGAWSKESAINMALKSIEEHKKKQ